MVTRLVLWLTVIFYIFYFAGHLFDLLANIPNWKSGNISEVSNYRDFYVNSSPKIYFAPLTILVPLLSLISMIFVWETGNPVRLYLIISLIISLVVLFYTIKFFIPINQYIFTTKEYDPVKLKELVVKWITMDYIRILLVGLGMLTTILGLNTYLK